ncbi:MAG: GspE/PulE family protein [Neomegalonema sp.]|nr:GspE/PulE family protein [Neomegalonema sp.]
MARDQAGSEWTAQEAVAHLRTTLLAMRACSADGFGRAADLAQRALSDGNPPLTLLTPEPARTLAAHREALLELRICEDDILARALAQISGQARLGSGVCEAERPASLRHEFFTALGAEVISASQIGQINPFDPRPAQGMRLVTGTAPEVLVASAAEIAALRRRRLGDAAEASEEEDAESLRRQAEEGPVIRQVNALIARAHESGASDIHLEAQPGGLTLRLRIDGVLREIPAPPADMATAIISRIKIMAGLDIAERRRPQDGRARADLGADALQGSRALDLRIATAPALHGESVTLRLLRRDGSVPPLESLGADPGAIAQINALLARSTGLLLVTGPTGSGKTTTLYAMLGRLRGPERKIMTIEDPVEYEIEGLTQIPVHPAIGVDFAATLRTSLRHDPDVVLVGETRDPETAKTAVQAALTGHLVLTSMHTNDAATAIARLAEMGVEPYLIPSTVSAAIAQRLLRRLCSDCRTPVERADPELAQRLGLEAAQARLGRSLRFYEAPGCAHCDQTGTKGRFAVFEILPMSDEIAHLAISNATAGQIRQAARSAGIRSMLDAALLAADAGDVSLDEIARVLGAVQ